MEQKIKVEVTPAANDQWPRVFDGALRAFAGGAKYAISISNGVAYMIVANGNSYVETEKKKCKFQPEFGSNCVGFQNLDSAYAYWANPMDIKFKAEPEKMELWRIPANSFFIHNGELYRDTDVSDGNGHCSVYHQKDGKIVQMSSETMVTPFKGTVTITVE